MADRIHPDHEEFIERPKPPPGTYVIQVPKDQIYRVPSPEKARLYQTYSRRASHRRRRSTRRCSCWIAGTLLFILLVAAAAAGSLYLALRPKLPRFSVDRLDVDAATLAASSATIRAENPNGKIRIHYRGGGGDSSVSVSYSGTALGNGAWPAFEQGTRNVTAVTTPLTAPDVPLSSSTRKSMSDDQRRGAVALTVAVKVPVRVALGSVKSWTVTVKVRCDVSVHNLTANSMIVSSDCNTKVDIF